MPKPFRAYNDLKTNFDSLYTADTPVPYMMGMREVGYEIPQNALGVLRVLLRHLERARHRTLTVLDIGCSYGVNAALLKYRTSLSDLYGHYSRVQNLSDRRERLLKQDIDYYSNLEPNFDVRIIGLDSSASAVEYGQQTGLLDEGIVANLEDDDHPPQAIHDVDLVVSTGAIGYVGARSLDRLLAAISRPANPWLALFVLRAIDYSPFASVLKRHEFETRVSGSSFVQRRICSDDELRGTMDHVARRGLNVAGYEDRGLLYADCYLSYRRAFGLHESVISQLGLR